MQTWLPEHTKFGKQVMVEAAFELKSISVYPSIEAAEHIVDRANKMIKWRKNYYLQP